MRRENINEAKFNTNDLLDSIESAYKKGGINGVIQGGKQFGLIDRTTVDELLDSAKSMFGTDLKKAAAEIKGFLKPQDCAKYKTKLESTQMDGENMDIQEKVDIDGRTRVYRETVMRLENSRKLREQRNRAMQENKFSGLYDDGSGKGAIIPAPVDFNFHEAMKIVKKYKSLREKKKTLMGSPNESMEAAVAMKDEKYTMSEEELSDKQKAYRTFFDKALKKFGASSPAKMDDGEKKKFFNYIKTNWKG
jgi:hypothetical protein